MRKITKKKVTAEQYQNALTGYIADENKVQGIINARDKDVQKLDEKYNPQFKAVMDSQVVHAEIVQQYCEENRETMFTDAKSIDTNGAKVGFKMSPAKIVLLAGFTNEQAITLLNKKLPGYVRTTEEISKAKLLEDKNLPEVVKNLPKCGLCMEQDETFFIKVAKSKK